MSSPVVPVTEPITTREKSGGLGHLLGKRPELAALAGAVVVFVFFAFAGGAPFYSPAGIASWLLPAAEIGIMVVPVALLMISGEFDLSIGSTIASSGMIVVVSVSHFGLPIEVGVLIAFAVAAFVGWFNGMLVVRTGLPSFIVTLATLFIIAGSTVGLTKMLTGSTILSLYGAQNESLLSVLFNSKFGGFSVVILWWIAITLIGIWVLGRTRFGNAVFATGGNIEAARNLGVRVDRTRLSLFIYSSLAACLVGVMQVFSFGSGDVSRGFQMEFQVIIAAVIGGCLLTGGAGSVIGAALGALTFGMAQRGIPFAGWDTTWFKAFMGAVLLIAVLINLYVGKQVRRSS